MATLDEIIVLVTIALEIGLDHKMGQGAAGCAQGISTTLPNRTKAHPTIAILISGQIRPSGVQIALAGAAEWMVAGRRQCLMGQ